MKSSVLRNSLVLTPFALLLAVPSLPAATHYVFLGSTNPTPTYTNWVTAATNIQDAVDAARAGETVLVTNGSYAGGVSVANPLTLLSVNGAQFTVIHGGGTNRCISLADGASLTGFTLTNGLADNAGGVLCSSTNVFLTNCVITAIRRPIAMVPAVGFVAAPSMTAPWLATTRAALAAERLRPRCTIAF